MLRNLIGKKKNNPLHLAKSKESKSTTEVKIGLISKLF